jgi:predicted permease
VKGAAAATAVALTRALLLLYPPSFRRDVGRALLGDVECRARELGGWRLAAFLVRLACSHLFNACAAWAGLAVRPAAWLDLKLAFRMLVKYPALTLVGGLGMAVAVTIGVGFFALLYPRFYPDIPLSEGERLVALQNRDRLTHRENRYALYDFGVWRAAVASVEDLTAFRTVSRNLIADNGSVEVVEAAEITPSGFRLARVPPHFGRTLVEHDAAADAPPAVVIGHDVWRTRFLSDPAVVGRTLRLGDTVHTVVGVMPEGFAFPVNHRFWIPLRADPSNYAPGEGPSIYISGRLAPGADSGVAHAELRALGERMARDLPDTHGMLRPEVVPYTYQFFGGNPDSASAFWPMTALVSLILVIVCVNVAILIYARTVNRLGEIAVRTALGASRRRIVTQLFAEALVLSTAAAGVGLLVVQTALTWVSGAVERFDDTTFWTTYALTGEAIVYCVALAGLAAVVTGVVPALRATGRRAQAELRLVSPGSGLRMGRVWSTLIVVQVSVASAGLPIAGAMGGLQVRDAFNMPDFPVDDMIFAHVGLESDRLPGEDPEAAGVAVAQRFAGVRAELARRLADEPGVAGHAFTLDLPLQGSSERIALEHDDTAHAGATYDVAQYRVDDAFFRTFDLDLLAGRPLVASDVGLTPTDVVVVDRAFVNKVLGGDQALGRRIRYVPPPGGGSGDSAPIRWLAIVGVVENLERNPFSDEALNPRVYRPMGADGNGSGLAVRLAGADPRVLGRRLSSLAAEIDPTFRVSIVAVGETYRTLRTVLGAAAFAIGAALSSVILLAAAGIYALMSFTVARRHREIAIRTALGASPRHLLGGLFSRAIRQIALGIAIGIALALLIDRYEGADDGGLLAGRPVWLLSGTVLLMGAVGFFATLGPARRGMRIQPAEALKGE